MDTYAPVELWIARDKNGSLWLYSAKPHRHNDEWVSDSDAAHVFYGIDSAQAVCQLADYTFSEITWENSPAKVSLMVGGCAEGGGC